MIRWWAQIALTAMVAALFVRVAESRGSRPSWTRVARDANYEISIDTVRINAMRVAASGRWYPGYEVWYRTVHAQPRLHKGDPFDREIVASIVQCDSLWFKVESVDMRLGDRKLVARQRMTEDELRDSPWRRVERGTTEEVAALAACHFGRRR